MPGFRYVARNTGGQTFDGVLDAASADEAIRQLSSAGMRVSRLEPASPAVGVIKTPPIQQPSPPQADLDWIPPNAVRTARGSARQRYFIFTQLSTLTASGIAPFQACLHVANRLSSGPFSESLRRASDFAREGRTMSDAFALYPDLYPPGVVGAVRAGEQGGFLPEALAAVEKQQEHTYRFARLELALWFVLLNLVGAPIVLGWLEGMKAMLRAIDSNPQGSFGATFLDGALGVLLGPIGWLFSALLVLAWPVRRWWLQPERTLWRHAVTLRTVGLKRRAAAENLAFFTWSLALISRGGVSPRSAWKLASEATPNLAYSRKLRSVGDQLHEGSKLSDAFGKAHVLPSEWTSIIENGELTGTVPAALEHVSSVGRKEFDFEQIRSTATIFGRAFVWGVLILFLLFALAVALYYRSAVSILLGS